MLLRKGVKNDLLIISAWTVLLAVITAFFPLGILRFILGLPVAFFFPGYTLLAAMFPEKSGLDSLERVAYSLGLSVTIVAFIGFFLNYTPWGIRLYPVLFANGLFIVVTSLIALLRRRKLPEEARFASAFNFNPIKWAGLRKLDKGLFIGLVLALLVALSTMGYAIATTRIGERFTQFYMLDTEGKTDNYPKELTVGEEARVVLKIINQEHETMSYRVQMSVDGAVTKEFNPVVLANEEVWQKEVTFTLTKVGGKQQVGFFLYRHLDEDLPYLSLYLWVDAKPAVTP